MIVFIDSDGSSTLTEAEHFEAFKVLVHQAVSEDELSTALSTLGERDGNHAWISVAELRQFRNVRDDALWQNSLTAMISKAAKNGWTDPDRKLIKAHIERLDK